MNRPFSLLYVILVPALVIAVWACSKEEAPVVEELTYEVEEHTVPTADEMSVTSDMPAYVFEYPYSGFGAALTARLTNRVTSADNNSAQNIVFHSSQTASLKGQFSLMLSHLMLGSNVIIVEPTLESFRTFCDAMIDTYNELVQNDESHEFFEELDAVDGLRQTMETFYQVSNDPNSLESMFVLDTDDKGVFAEALAVRGCEFHLVERLNAEENSMMTHQTIIHEEGEIEESEAPEVEMSEFSLTPYTYGLFADMLTKWINDHDDYDERLAAISERSLKSVNTKAESTTKFNLEDICSVQNMKYTFKASTPYSVSSPLPVTVNFEVCSIYMEHEDCDYYCVYKDICSYNQELNCGPEKSREWRNSPNFMFVLFLTSGEQPYYGPFMRDLKSKSICHADTDDFNLMQNGKIDLPSSSKIEPLPDVAIEKYSPKNSIGSTDHTSGFSYGFDGGLYIAKDPSLNIGFNVSYDSSTTQTIDDLEIEASTSGGVAEWTYTGNNLPQAYFNMVKRNSHSFAPSIMRQQCSVDQSWIWRVPNPKGAYRLYDETSVTTSLMYFNSSFFKAHTKFANNEVTKRVSFMMTPPPRSEQIWVMNVSPYSDQLNAMLSTTHNRFWNKDNHEFKLADSSPDSRITINQFISDFEKDLSSKKHSWLNRNFKGTYKFSYYNVNGGPDEILSFDFVVN